VRGEQLLQIGIGHRVREVADVELLSHHTLL
jgi:hypothetical protein